jgi:hypothetical protein
LKEKIMQLEITETPVVGQRLSFFNIRWGAIFAGLAVGIAANFLLMLIGTATGLSLFNVGSNSPSGETISIAASIWNTVSMLISAFIGGYVAARTSGLKRTSDGILHAVVAWGMTLLLSIFLATSVTGATINSIFPAQQGRGAVANTAGVINNIDSGNRQAAVDALQRNLNLTPSQASEVIDQALILSGREEQAAPSSREGAQNTVKAVATVSAWLAVSITLSLLTAIGGGLSGARGSRRILHRRVTTLS